MPCDSEYPSRTALAETRRRSGRCCLMLELLMALEAFYSQLVSAYSIKHMANVTALTSRLTSPLFIQSFSADAPARQSRHSWLMLKTSQRGEQTRLPEIRTSQRGEQTQLPDVKTPERGRAGTAA